MQGPHLVRRNRLGPLLVRSTQIFLLQLAVLSDEYAKKYFLVYFLLNLHFCFFFAKKLQINNDEYMCFLVVDFRMRNTSFELKNRTFQSLNNCRLRGWSFPYEFHAR